MSAINKFDNIADYNAHTKPTTNSEVSLVVTPKDLHYDGLNVERAYIVSNVAPSSRETFYYTPNNGQATGTANACFGYRCVPCTILDLN